MVVTRGHCLVKAKVRSIDIDIPWIRVYNPALAVASGTSGMGPGDAIVWP